MRGKGFDPKFPGIPASFPEQPDKFVDFGQNLKKSPLENEKFAAKFAEAGNLCFYEMPQFSPMFFQHAQDLMQPVVEIFNEPGWADGMESHLPERNRIT